MELTSLAKKCPNCNSKNTEVWGTGGMLDSPDFWVTGRAYYCHNCGNAFD